jgi:rhodanese-related sulfurtransferase
MRSMFLLAVLLLFVAIIPSLAAPDSEVPRMTKEDLKSLLGNRDLVIFDVRTVADYNTSTTKIKGAVRINPKAPVQTWMDKYTKNKIYVFYCR